MSPMQIERTSPITIAFSHKIRWGAQGVSRMVTGKTGLHARVEGERVIALESW